MDSTPRLQDLPEIPAYASIVADNITTNVEGFGVRKDNAAGLAYFNDWIGKNKEFLKQRHTYWFKTQDWASMVP